MSCCNTPGTGCCGSSCLCQENVGCLDGVDCGGFKPRGTAATGACPGPCQCADEDAWNRNIPPKPNCEWLSNFSELRRQWSDHGRKNNCKCCRCSPSRKSSPCRPCLRSIKHCNSPPSTLLCNYGERLAGGACCGSYDNDQRNCPGTSNSSPCQSCPLARKPIMKPPTCCQCTDNYCMCQPIPRPCNCPPPVPIDARAERGCTCECPSSPECACPPSERKFPKTRIKCPNAKVCCPTPRPQPGPRCNCTKCQTCSPSPCDPCSSSKCCPPVVRIQTCPPEPPCNNRATPSCSPCSRPSSSSCRNEPMKSICVTPCLRKSGQFTSNTSLNYNNNYFTEVIEESEGMGKRNNIMSEQCQCGDDARGCADDCHYCCSQNCSDNQSLDNEKIQKSQCNCGYNADGCADNCNYCCADECTNSEKPRDKRMRISAGSENKSDTYQHSNVKGNKIEERKSDEFSECKLNIEYLQNSQLKDLQRPSDSLNPSTKPRRSSRLLQSLIRGKSSKAQAHH